jgi:hypothetical protein
MPAIPVKNPKEHAMPTYHTLHTIEWLELKKLRQVNPKNLHPAKADRQPIKQYLKLV